MAITSDGPWVLTARAEEKVASPDQPERARLTAGGTAVSVADGGPDAG